MPAKGHASRMGGNCWSRGRTVRLLLSCAQGECRPSWAPPISMTTVLLAGAHQAIGVKAHCLLPVDRRSWKRRALQASQPSTKTRCNAEDLPTQERGGSGWRHDDDAPACGGPQHGARADQWFGSTGSESGHGGLSTPGFGGRCIAGGRRSAVCAIVAAIGLKRPGAPRFFVPLLFG